MMQFRRNGQGDERRRRVFRDEMIAAPGQQAEDNGRPARDEAEGRIYPDAALAQRQSPITSLLPQRALTLTALLLAGGLAITGIELLYARLFVGLPEAYRESLVALDLTARGNVAQWFASLTLAVGAATSLLVYLIRRHRLDDYRGRYRMWQWAAACFVIGSFDVATGAHAILQPTMIQLTGTTLLGNAALWSVLLVGAMLAMCLLRMAIEIRGSRLATTFLCLSAGAYIGFAVARFHPGLSVTELVREVACSSTLLAGHFCLVYSVALYGRHVYQEAQGTRRAGRVKPVVAADSEPKKPRSTSRRRAVEGTVKNKNVRVDAAHAQPADESAPAAVPTISKKTVQKTVRAAADDDSADNGRSVSKAERRRLRKLERRQQRQSDEDE